MRRLIPLFIIIFVFVSSCRRQESVRKNDTDAINFLSSYSIVVNTERPKYSSTVFVPKIFDTTWRLRDLLSKDVLGISLKKYRGKRCSIYMYPLAEIPFEIKSDAASEARAVIICCEDIIVCSYIEFISPLRSIPPISLEGSTIEDLSGIKWDSWKEDIDSDDNKHLVIWQYYEALMVGNYEGAYWYVYDKESINKNDFINAAKQGGLPYIDFLDMEQYKKPSEDESYFVVRAKVGGTQESPGNIYEITFDLKRDVEEKQYGGWKILRTKIK